MKQNTVICDQCQGPIDLAKGKITFHPLRGGLDIIAETADGCANMFVNQDTEFCDEICVADFIKSIAAKIKPVRTITALLIALCVFCASAFNCKAQTFSGLLSLTGTNYAPVLLHFQTQSNLSYMNVQAQTLIVTNINTNEAIYVAYLSQCTYAPGTNLYALTGFWTNFPAASGWTNGATWMYPVPAMSFTVPTSPWGELVISNGQFASGSCTNGVGFQ